MRLLQRLPDDSLILKTFPDANPPRYAILSHRWGNDEDEVSFRDIDPERGHGTSETQGGARVKPGYRKLDFCLKQAAADELQWVWIDTCCINKDSQVELGRAINWMYRWYAASHVCYAYLADVSTGTGNLNWREQFGKSVWFKRGWTLQELIAPTSMRFFSYEGQVLGSKAELAELIHAATGITSDVFNSHSPTQSYTLQTRLDWAIGRETTEEEDRIYSLFGILEVSFTPHYGEGYSAALRSLRTALLEKHRDEILILDFHQPSSTLDRVRNIVAVKANPVEDAAKGMEESESEERQWLKELAKDLSFPMQYARKANIQNPAATTCDWVFKHPQYLRWTSGPISDRLLWIKGKPGAGKSTIVKHIESRVAISSSRQKDIVISFYFHARGTKLEQSTEGLYRSLVCQLLDSAKSIQIHGLQQILQPHLPRRVDGPWSKSTLQLLLTALANALCKSSVCIFIDALDECREDDIREVLHFLDDLGQASLENKRCIRMCFASRYYPTLVIPAARELRLEDESEHVKDMETYVHRYLNIGTDVTAAAIRRKVLRKADGIFIWLVFVIRLLNTDFERGLLEELEQKLDSLPGDMMTLFQEIMQQDGVHYEDFTLALRWILFAACPLSGREFYSAMMASNRINRQPRYESEAVSLELEAIARFVTFYTKGLAELTVLRHGDRVQFIHETVRDFLLHDTGWTRSMPRELDLAAYSHEILKDTCSRYLNYFVTTSSARKHETETTLSSWKLALFKYAMSNLFNHADEAARSQNQSRFLLEHGLDFWQRAVSCMTTTWTLPNAWTKHCSMVHMLVEMNKPRLLLTHFHATIRDANYMSPARQLWRCDEQCARMSILSRQMQSELECRDHRGKTPLSRAAADGRLDLVNILLRHGSDPNSKDDEGRSGLMDICQGVQVSENDAATLINLLRKGNVDLEARDSVGETALFKVCHKDNVVMLKVLLENGASVNSHDYKGNTPLHNTHSQSCRTALLNYGADINARNHHGQTPLMRAAERVDQSHVSALIARGAKIDVQDSHGTSVLMYIVRSYSTWAGIHDFDWGLELVLNIIQGTTDITARNQQDETAMSLAEEGRAPQVVALLQEVEQQRQCGNW